MVLGVPILKHFRVFFFKSIKAFWKVFHQLGKQTGSHIVVPSFENGGNHCGLLIHLKILKDEIETQEGFLCWYIVLILK